MQSLFRCHIYSFFCLSLKLKYKTLIFSLKHQEKDPHVCNGNRVGILKMKKNQNPKYLMSIGLLNLGNKFCDALQNS
jgi:hypothetical protein